MPKHVSANCAKPVTPSLNSSGYENPVAGLTVVPSF